MDTGLPMGAQITIMVTMFGLIIGVYYALYRHQQSINSQLGNMYSAINQHIQQTSIHANGNEFVRKDMCKLLHQQAIDNNAELKSEMAAIKVILQELRDYMIKKG